MTEEPVAVLTDRNTGNKKDFKIELGDFKSFQGNVYIDEKFSLYLMGKTPNERAFVDPSNIESIVLEENGKKMKITLDFTLESGFYKHPVTVRISDGGDPSIRALFYNMYLRYMKEDYHESTFQNN